MKQDEISSLVSCFWCEQRHQGEHPLSVCSACRARYATLQSLQSLEMRGPYPLTDEAIDALITSISPGNYALGYLDDDSFRVFYVGRSDSDVRRCLHQWVGMPSQYEKYSSPAKASWGVRRRSLLPVDAPALVRVANTASPYTRFAFSYARSAGEAYAKEWRNYDAFGGTHGLDNDTEPCRTR